MKVFTLAFFLLLICGPLAAQTPLVADAGKDTVLCESSLNDTVRVGGVLPAQGGVGGYTYQWDMYPKPYVPFSSLPSLKKWPSDMLSDTTIANPQVLDVPLNKDGPIYFVLTVTDSSGQVARDTNMYYGISFVKTLDNLPVNTFPGDTQRVSTGGFGGGIPPYSIDWGDSSNLIGSRYDYNIPSSGAISTRNIVIPEGPQIYSYGVRAIDSTGCGTIVGSWEIYYIQMVSIEDDLTAEYASLFPNPVQTYLHILLPKDEIQQVSLTDLSGRVIALPEVEEIGVDQSGIDLSQLENGNYWVTLKTTKGVVTRPIIKKD